MDYRPEELTRALDRTFLQRGRHYWHQGRVLSAHREGNDVHARIEGSNGAVYSCDISLGRDALNQLRVDGQCNCPVGFNCKHVAAALLAAAEVPEAPALEQTDPLLDRWLAELSEAESDPETYPDDVHERLLYVLSLREHPTGARSLSVEPQRARQRSGGGFSAASPFRTSASAPFLRPSDHNLLRQLAAFSGGVDYQLKGDWGAQLLETMLRTGRAHWQHIGRPLTRGPSKAAEFRWELDPAGRQVLTLDPGDGRQVLPLMPPWYLDAESGEAGVLETGMPARLAGALCNAPRLTPEAAEAVTERLRGLPVPPVPKLKRHRRTDVRPRPVLRLSSRRRDVHETARTVMRLDLYGGAASPDWLDQAQLQFDYQGARINAADPTDPLQRREGELLIEVSRQRSAEVSAKSQLTGSGFEPMSSPGVYTQPSDSAWLAFMVEGLPALRAAGWQIDVDPDFRFRVAQAGEWYAEVDDESSSDWFSLDLGVTVDGQRTSLLPLLARMVQELPVHARQALMDMPADRELMLPLADGRLLPLPVARVRPMLSALLELYDPGSLDAEGHLRLSRLRSPALAELAAGGAMTWAGGETVRRFGERLKDFRGIESVEPPEALAATLRDYQRDGLNWLQFLRDYGLSGILADDMGLGKTLQTLAHLLLEKQAGRADRPSLVVAPTSLLTNWRREAERFAPGLSVLTLHGSQRAADFDAIGEHDLVLTSYALLPRDLKALQAHHYHLVILDEAQHIKNPRSKAAEGAALLTARQRLCLTGTPLENHLGELWSLFHFLMPGLLGERDRFNRLFRTPIERQGDQERREQLKRRVAPFMLRRTKEAVARELPPKTELLRSVVLEGSQRDLYETVRLALNERIREEVRRRGWAQSQIVILDALLKLRQICCDPRLVKLESAKSIKHSAKLDMLMELLPELIEEGRRVLLFSQFTGMLSLIEKAVAKVNIPYVKLTGSTKDRATPVDRFQAGEVPLFLISLKAGGTGLNLTAADTVIHYDPWWNPAVERQATDRAHRIGQDKPVFVYKLICEGTVEERMLELQARKAALSAAVLEAGDATSGGLRAEDLEALLGPLE